ncbi:MAG: carboxypeptidase-like regulatory domain-containing protein [Caldilineaceae bacterium]
MELYEYPRPANDTGIGIHWVTGFAAAVGMSRLREYWIPELKALGVKWVKLPNHDGALEFAELLLAEDIMPVVRIFRPNPNPGRLGVREIVHLDALLRAGVRYFEFNNEPDRDAEWKGGRRPSGARDIVAENTVANMEIIYERGGMPAIPAVSGGSDWDLVERIVAMGRRDLFDGPVWQAVHNYPRNRPLDYPFDIGNQEGAAYTERFYRAVADEAWGENAWRGRTLQDVNRLRLSRSNPGATLVQDHDCWLAYSYFDACNRAHLGRSIPILSTETGYIVGEDTDPRYPATTPDLHMAQTLEACRIMMGTSRRYDHAPDYYFCSAFWLMANRQLGSSSDWWEGQAWYSDRWSGGALPIVRALRAEPKAARRWHDPEAEAMITLRGTVHHAGEMRTVVVERGSNEVRRVRLDSGDQYVVPELLPGQYTVRLPEAQVTQQVTLSGDQTNVVLNFDLSHEQAAVSNSAVTGTVRGGAGAVVMLLRASDGEEWITLAREDGEFRFVDLPSGKYSVRIHPAGTRMEAILLDGLNTRQVELSVDGWGHTVQYREDDPRAYAGVVRCVVDGQTDVEVHLEGASGQGARLRTGSAADLGRDVCEFSGVEPGDYLVVVNGVTNADDTHRLEARVHVDRKRVPEVRFVHSETAGEEQPTRSACIVGHVVGMPAGQTAKVGLLDSRAQRRTTVTDAQGGFTFADLAAGTYTVALEGVDPPVAQEVALDGKNEVSVDLVLPALPAEAHAEPKVGASMVRGLAPEAAGRLARLVDAVGNEYTRLVDERDHFHFDHLPAGEYTLHVEGGYAQHELTLDGKGGLDVLFSPLAYTWSAEETSGGAMPGFSLLRVEVEGADDWPVHIWQEDGAPIVARTGMKPEFSAHVVEFGPLEPGIYLVGPKSWTCAPRSS